LPEQLARRRLDAVKLGAAQALTSSTGVELMLATPAAKCLGRTADPGRDGHDGRRLRPVPGAVLEHPAHGALGEALAVFDEGLKRFPESNVLRVFRAFALYNLASYNDAVATLLEILASTSSDSEIPEYERALQLYATDLDWRW
jgi:hypothetical protein